MCFNDENIKVKTLIFLRMNYIKKYNNKMGGVDISDKIMNYYMIDLGVSNSPTRCKRGNLARGPRLCRGVTHRPPNNATFPLGDYNTQR